MSDPARPLVEVIAWGGAREGLSEDMAQALRQQDFAPDVVTPTIGGIDQANAAGRASRADVLVFLHADVRPCHGWLRRLVTVLLSSPQADVGIPRLLPGGLAGWRSVTPDGRRKAWTGAPQAGFAAATAGAQPWADARCLAVRREAFVAADGFDETLGGFAGADLAARLGGAPTHAVLVPAARAIDNRRSGAAEHITTRAAGLAYWARRTVEGSEAPRPVVVRARERRDALLRASERLGAEDRAQIERRLSRLDALKPATPIAAVNRRRPERIIAPMSRLQLRFCFVLPGYVPSSAARTAHDAVEAFATDLARGLVERGECVHVVRRAITPSPAPRWDGGVWLHDAPRQAQPLKLEHVPVLEGWPASVARRTRQVCATDGMDLIVTSVSSNAADAVSAACRSNVLVLAGPRGPVFLANWKRPWTTMRPPREGLEPALDWISAIARSQRGDDSLLDAIPDTTHAPPSPVRPIELTEQV